MYNYRAYGFTIQSDIELPELTNASGSPDVRIYRGALGYEPPSPSEVPFKFWQSADGMYQWWDGIGTFLVRAGSEIIVDAVPQVEESRMRLFILGAAMGAILSQRGFFVLHASAIDLQGSAALFLGGKGWGKSTMTAYLHSRGHRFLSDDVVALKLSDSAVLAIPSFPQLKLWPDAVESLGENPDALPRLSSLFDKRHRAVEGGYSDAPVPIKHIYVLTKGDKVNIEPISTSEAIINLLSNLYVARFGKEYVRASESENFLQASEIARDIPAYRLSRPSDLGLMPEIAENVETHILRGSQLSLASTKL